MVEKQNDPSNTLREAYLSNVYQRLQTRVTPLEVFESIEEMRTHIDAMAAAYVELGMTPLEAMKAALEKFGAADQVGKDYRKPLLGSFPATTAVGILITVTADMLLGADLMAAVDGGFFRAGVNGIQVLTFLFGAAVGGSIGLLAWYSRLKPVTFACTMLVVPTAYLGILYFNFIPGPRLYLGGGLMAEHAVLMNLCAFFLGLFGAWLARYLKRVLPGSALRSSQSAAN